jgi:hypothetical protein
MRLTRLVSSFRPARIILAFFACVMMLFSYAMPAYSDGYRDPVINSQPSSPTEGEAKLTGIYEKSEDALRQAPPSMAKEQAEQVGGGLNVDQGTADINKMARPETSSRKATSAEDSAERGLGKLLGR